MYGLQTVFFQLDFAKNCAVNIVCHHSTSSQHLAPSTWTLPELKKEQKMEESEGKLKASLQHLSLSASKTDKIAEKGNLEKIQRYQDTLRKLIDAAEDLKTEQEKVMFEKGESSESVKQWGQKVETVIEKTDLKIEQTKQFLQEAQAIAEAGQKQRRETWKKLCLHTNAKKE